MSDFAVQIGDVCDIPSDLLLLKHAQGFYGADKAVATRLINAGVCTDRQLRLAPDEFFIVETKGLLAARRVMFVGTPDLSGFNYHEMQHFAYRAIEILATEHVPVKRMTTTVHGSGYGLDAGESLQRLILGFHSALAEFHTFAIEQILFLSLGERATRMLSSILEHMNAPIAVAPQAPAPVPPRRNHS